jgi:ribosomal protein L40E
MSDNVNEFLVFPVRAEAEANFSQSTQNNVCHKCGAQVSPHDVFCGICGTKVQSEPQSYQQSQTPPRPQQYQQSQTLPQSQPQANINTQVGSQPYQQPYMSSPPQQPSKTNAQLGSKPLGVKGMKAKVEGNHTLGIVLLSVGMVIIISCFIVGINVLDYEWYEVLLSFFFSYKYPGHPGLTILSFVLSFIIYGGGFLVLAGIASFFPDDKDDNEKS